jgi:hypothetical protein
MTPSCAPAPGATSAVTTSDAMSVTRSRDKKPGLLFSGIVPTLGAVGGHFY